MTEKLTLEMFQESVEKIRDRGFEYKSQPVSYDVITRLFNAESEIRELREKLNTCKNDYWFMSNLIEHYSSDKDQTLKDCLERMKFRRPIFKVLGDESQEALEKLRGEERKSKYPCTSGCGHKECQPDLSLITEMVEERDRVLSNLEINEGEK